MLIAVLALPFAAQLLAPPAFAQSQFTRPAQTAEATRFREMDRNRDGVVTRAEWRGSDRSFEAHDWNRDGILSGDEVREGAQPPFDRNRQDSGIRDDREDTFEDLDVNRNNQIERHEWHASSDAFDWLDRNRDGVLSRREVVGRGAERVPGAARTPIPGTGGAAPQGTGDCVDNAARIVDDTYQQVLERPADQASAGFTQELTSGKMTVREIVTQLAKSEEHASRFYWRPLVTSLYQQLMRREPNQQELQQATADLASGRRQLVDVVARTARRAASSDEEAVKALYRHLLGREADPAGLRGFTEQAGRQGIESVARDIVASAEYNQRSRGSRLLVSAGAYESVVRTLYRHVLARDVDQSALQLLVETAAINGFEAVIDAIVSTPEYTRLYGTDVVPGRGARYCAGTR